jgi:ferritin-like metal-binding protein YciE
MQDLLVHELQDLHSAEKQLIKALPKMAQAAHAPELQQALEMHLQETEQHAERLDSIFQQIGASPGRKTCKAMQGLIEEGSELMKEDGEPMVMDAALIAAAQRVEHYEIAGYGCARTFAQYLGMNEVADTLQTTLDEEKQADEKLNQIAMGFVNAEAVEEGNT